MAVRFNESDLDLAFRFQLEEAIAASLSIGTSSSTSAPQPPLPLAEDTKEQYETETRDRILALSETRKMHEDFHRRINDRKIAREIVLMPEDEWLEFGDNSPHRREEGLSSSSSKSTTITDEVFRVYFKGLLSEERVGSSDSTVTMAGIGVAICDSRDELIFEMRKPLDLGKDDQMSRKSVEWEALIEALNAAAALGLKRIALSCDSYTIYQFLTGRWLPKQQKIKTFVNNVNLLRKEFEYCVPSHVARNDVKFVFKLAREAIVSQINKPSESNVNLENCVICLEDSSADQFFSVDGCKHRYCFSCMKQHVKVKLLHGMVPKCPHEGCQSELKIDSCEIFLTPNLVEMMSQLLKEASIPVTERIYCPYPKCSALMSKTEAYENSKFLLIDVISGARRCKKCCDYFCINCKVPWHSSMTCAEYKRRNPNPLLEESKLKNLAARNLWRQCVKCKHMIELAAGCYHMTCRCGYEFCYTCGAEWKNKKATCSCPLWDEENIVDTEDENDVVDAEVYEDGDDNYDSDSDDYF